MIVITAPTGQIGRQVLGNLLDSGEQLRVIALDPSQLPAEVCDDLDIVEGSHGDAAVVDNAFASADAVFWLTPPDPRAPSVEAAFAGFTRPAAEAFKRHGDRPRPRPTEGAAAKPDRWRPVIRSGLPVRRAQPGIVPLRSLTVKPSSACLSATSMSSWCMTHSPRPGRWSGMLLGAGTRPARRSAGPRPLS